MFGKPLTGYHVLAIFCSAFAVIIAVNLTLAFQAVGTFPGLETKNSYVASQKFDSDRDAQLALGWTVGAELQGSNLVLKVDDAIGPVVPKIVSATLGRATHVGDDQTPAFLHDGTQFVAPVGDLERGNWNLRLVAEAADGTLFRQRIVIWVGL